MEAKQPRPHFKAVATAPNVTAQEGQREAAQLNNGEWVPDEGGRGSARGRVQHLSVLRSASCPWCEEGKLPAPTTFLGGSRQRALELDGRGPSAEVGSAA